MVVSAYSAKSVKARNVLAMADPDDVFSVHCFCTAHVNIESARFYEKYMGPNQFHRPYMRLVGSVTDLFLENQGEMFPCGTNSIQFIEPQSVTINYALSYEEIGLLASRGLYCKGYTPPDNITGNVMEIPVSVVYKGVYDTPCCFVDIVDQYEIPTSTQLNGYVGLFQVAEVHPDVIAQLEAAPLVGLPVPKEYASQYDVQLESEGEFYNEQPTPDQVYNDTYQEEEQEEAPREISPEEREEIDIIDRVNAKIDNRASDDEITRVNNKADDKSILDLINAVNSEVAADQADADDTQNLYHDTDAAANQTVVGGISKLTDRMSYLKRKAQSDANEQQNIARNNDIAADNIALNEGITDIAGQGAGDGELASFTDKQKAKSEKNAKKQRDIARNNDIAADNMALNEGITDIAGHGAASKPSDSAQSLLAGLGVSSPKPSAPQDDESSKFL